MATVTLIPSGYRDLTGMTIASSYPITRAYTNSSSTNYARFNISQSTTGSVYLTFDTSSIPSGATNISLTGNFKARVSNTTRVSSTGARLYSGTTAMGTSVAFASTTASVRSLTTGTGWTRADLNDLRLYVTGRGSSSTSSKRIDFYGADVTVTYTEASVAVTGVSLDKSTDTVEVGDTTTLTETVIPSNATNKNVTWSTSNSSVATVSGGVVTGVSAGTARITVTTVDGGFTAYCDVTVTQPITYEYRLATTMQVGKEYLIANGNSGTVSLLTNVSGGSRTLQGVTATVTDGKIQITGAVKSKALFECVRYTVGNDNTITVAKDGEYLFCNNANGLVMNNPATLDRFWHYRDNKFWCFKGTTSDGYDDTSTDYKYYITWNNGNATDGHVDTTSIKDSNIPLTYIFTEYTPSTEIPYIKRNGSWVEVSKVYKKVSGVWVEQAELSNVFDSGTNYHLNS